MTLEKGMTLTFACKPRLFPKLVLNGAQAPLEQLRVFSSYCVHLHLDKKLDVGRVYNYLGIQLSVVSISSSKASSEQLAG